VGGGRLRAKHAFGATYQENAMHQQFNEGFLKILQRPACCKLEIKGKGSLKLPCEGEFEGDFLVTWTSDNLACELSYAPLSRTSPIHGREPAEIGKVVPNDYYGEAMGISDQGVPIIIRRCLWTGSHHSGTISSVRCWAGTLELKYGDLVPPFYESYTVYGLSMSTWPNGTELHHENGGFGFTYNALDTVLDGEPVRLQSLGEHFCRLVFQKPSSSPLARRELVEETLPLLSFILGARLSVVREEVFSEHGQILQDTYLHTTRSYDLATYRSPIFTSAGSKSFFHLGEVIADLYERYKFWKEKIFLDEAIFHKMAAERMPAESKFAMLAIAFETLSSSYARWSHKGSEKQDASTYLDWNQFHLATKDIAQDLKKAIGPLMKDEKAIDSMMGKFDAINNRAMQDRFKSLFADLGIVPNENEKEALRKRNSAIHEGVLDRDRNNLDLQHIVDLEATMMVLVNKMVLNLLGYRGHIIDYAARGYPDVLIDKANKPAQPVTPVD
jgi:hypothetical protein